MKRLLRSPFARDVKLVVNYLAVGVLLAVAWAGYELWLSKYALGTALASVIAFAVVTVNLFIHNDEEETR